MTMKQACCIITINVKLSVYYIIGEFLSYIIGTYFIIPSGNFAALLVSCYIIGKFGVTLSVDITLRVVVTLSGVTWPSVHVLCSKAWCSEAKA